MKKLILSIMVVLVAGSFAVAQNDKTTADTKPVSNPNAPVMKFENDVFDFGTIKQGDKVEHTFVFTNAGKEPLIITEAHGSCGCTVPEWPKEPLKKGEKGSIKVTFNSSGKMGVQEKTITINSNASENPKILRIKGNIEQSPTAPETKPADHSHH